MNKHNEHRWQKAYPPNLEWQLEAVNRPVHAIFEDAAIAYPHRTCLDFLDKKYTYAEIHEQITLFACGLQKMGLRKGGHIGLCLPNSPYYVVAYYAALKIGAIVVNFNILYTESEIKQQVEDSEIEIMVTVDLALVFGKIYSCLNSTQLTKIIYCPFANILPGFKKLLFRVFKFRDRATIPKADNVISFEVVSTNKKKLSPVTIDPLLDIALFQYTGGTTGKPKAAMLTHSNVTSNTTQVTHWLESGLNNEAPDKFLAVIPFFHVFAMTAVLNMGINRGAEIILLPRFDLRQLLRVINTKKPNIFPGIPAIFNAINNDPLLQKYDLSSIQYCISGGAALPVTVKRQFEEHSGCILVEGYGLSETSPVVTCNPSQNGGKEGSIGLPLPGTEVEIRCLEDNAMQAETLEQGEIVVRGPQVMSGYWNNPKDSADPFLPGRWFRTGDVGYMDEEGYVFLTDRIKDIIISNGYKIYPRIVEEAFYLHPGVSEVVVIGIPNEETGESPKAFVTLKADVHVSEKELLEFAVSKLNPIERPVAVEIRKALPKSLVGKLSRKELIQEEANKRKE